MRVVGADIGTTRTRIVVYDESLEPVGEKVLPSPLRVEGPRAVHDPEGLRGLVGEILRAEAGARGLALYRASVAAWSPGGDPLTPVVLWMDDETRGMAVRSLPLLGRILRRVPPYRSVLDVRSPLPTIAYLARKHRGARVWTVDALVQEWAGAGYGSDEPSAAVTGLLHPATLREIPLARRAAGVPRWHEMPRLTHSTLEDGRLDAILPDQQAASLGVSCTRPGCLRISLGTGAFADLALEEPMRLPRRGAIPIVLYSVPGRRIPGAETMVPGLGHAVARHVEAMGGWDRLYRLRPEDCMRSLRPVSPLRASGPVRPCDILVGAVLDVAAAVNRLPWGFRRVWIVGGLARVPLVRRLLALLVPGGRASYYHGMAAARGAASMALYARGLQGSPEPPEPVGEELPRPSDPGLVYEVLDAWRRGLITEPEGARDPLPMLLEELAGWERR